MIRWLSERYKENPERFDLRVVAAKPRCRIVQPNAEPCCGEVTADVSISDVLLELSFLSVERRTALTTRIIENDKTKVRKIEVVKEPGYIDPVLYIDVEQTLALRDGDQPLRLRLRQTTERVNTEGIGNKLSIATGNSDSAGLIIRNSLVDEAETTDYLSTSRYNTCLTLSADPENPDKLRITFADDIEMTFYKKYSSSFVNTLYRSVASSAGAIQLQQTVEGTLKQAKENFSRLAQEGGDFLDQ